jgi:hypothetical protein
MLYGHAMHLAANAVNAFATEIRDYRAVLPDDMYALLYFFDEHLGHLLFFGGIHSLLGLWVWVGLEDPVGRMAPRQLAWVIAAGVVEGATLAIALIEATYPWLGYVASAVLLVLVGVGGSRAQEVDARLALRERPIWVFAGVSAVSQIIVATIYYLVFGFTEISRLPR